MWNYIPNPKQNLKQNECGFLDTSIDETYLKRKESLKKKRNSNCVPIMIDHLNRYGQKLTVWGIPAKIVTFVAIVRKIERMRTEASYEFQDETGSIRGIKWLEDDSVDYVSPVEVDTYARVYGLIRDQNEDHYVLIVNIRPLEHMNELLAHLMEVTLMALQGEKLANKVTQSDNLMTSKNNSMAVNDGVNASGLTSEQQLVLDIIQNSDSEYGAERDAIKARVPSYLVSKVDHIIDFLSAEGHIYTTKTDDFFKAI